MRSEFYDEVREATRDEFDLLGELGGGEAWAVFLGRGRDGGALALLLLQEAEDGGGEYDLEVIQALEPGLPVGRTTCGGCGTGEAGWPRFCSGCGADLSGVQADAAVFGGSAAELLQEVCGAAEGEYRVLGALPHAEGGGALYFAREENTGCLVGLALREDPGGELALVVSWTAGTADVDAVAPASPPGPFVVGEEDRREPLVQREEAEPVPPLWDPPSARARGRSRERTRRLAAGAAIASIVVALGVAVVWAITGPGAGVPANAGTKAMAPGRVVEASPDAAAGPGDSTALQAAPSGGSATNPGVQTGPPDSPRPRPQPAAPAPAVVTAPAVQPGRQAAATAPSPAPLAEPAVEPALTPTADGVEAAVRRYAQAVGSCQTSRISRAYPGITPAEMDRWENFFRLNCNAGVKAAFAAESEPAVDGDRAELLFTLTLAYTGPSGGSVRQPLPLRAVLQWRQGAWTLQEVRSLGAR